MLVPEIIKKINSNKVVIKYGNDYVLLSYSDYYQHPETLAFICDEEGNVSNWLEVAGGSGMSASPSSAGAIPRSRKPFICPIWPNTSPSCTGVTTVTSGRWEPPP